MKPPAGLARPSAELAQLTGWLRRNKALPFYTLARRATAAGMPVSACTLRRALDGRLPSRRTTLAFALGAGADQQTAERLWAAADAAARRRPTPAGPGSGYVPGWITTRTGLVTAMQRIRNQAAGPHTLRALAEVPEAAGQFGKSTLHRILTGEILPTAEQLAALAAACHAGPAVTSALLAALGRILDGPRPPAVYICDIVDRADERRQQEEAARPWKVEPPELDDYDRQLDAEWAAHNAGEMAHHRTDRGMGAGDATARGPGR